MSFMLLYLKDRLLTITTEQEDTKAAGVDAEKIRDNHLHDPDEEQGQVEGEGQVEAAASGGESIVEGSHPESDDNDDSDIEMSHIYKDSAADVIPIHQNPMHDPEDIGSNDRNITTVKAPNMELKSKVADLEFEIENIKETRADLVSQNQVLVSQNQALQQIVQELQSQVKDYQKKDDEENL